MFEDAHDHGDDHDDRGVDDRRTEVDLPSPVQQRRDGLDQRIRGHPHHERRIDEEDDGFEVPEAHRERVLRAPGEPVGHRPRDEARDGERDDRHHRVHEGEDSVEEDRERSRDESESDAEDGDEEDRCEGDLECLLFGAHATDRSLHLGGCPGTILAIPPRRSPGPDPTMRPRGDASAIRASVPAGTFRLRPAPSRLVP